MEPIKFSSTKLVGTGKKGILKPDANGYYTLPIGGLNVLNSAGQYYTADGAKELFESSSIFMRRVKNGCLKGELGHPKQLPGQSMDAYVNRVLTIDEGNVVCHFKDIWLDTEFGKNNPKYNNKDLIAIMGSVKPSGPHAACLEASFNNPDEDVCFSIRALTRDYYQRGMTYRVLTQIVSFDNVTEPGLSHARKYDSPSLESTDDTIITKKTLENILKNNTTCLATEDTKAMVIETLNNYQSTIVTLPSFSKW